MVFVPFLFLTSSYLTSKPSEIFGFLIFKITFSTTVLQLPTSIISIDFFILESIYINLPLFIIFCIFRSLTKVSLIYQFLTSLRPLFCLSTTFNVSNISHISLLSSSSSYFIIQVFKQRFTNSLSWLATYSYYSYLARPQSWLKDWWKMSIFSMPIPVLISVLEEILWFPLLIMVD